MNRADIDKLRSLSAMLKPLMDLPAMLEVALGAEQATREAEVRLAKLTAEGAALMEQSAQAQVDASKAKSEASEMLDAAKARAAEIVEKALTEAQDVNDEANSQASRILKDATTRAEAALNRAKTIDQSIAGKTAELQKIESKIESAKAAMRKMLD
jgi:chromosome segregation ATPase